MKTAIKSIKSLKLEIGGYGSECKEYLIKSEEMEYWEPFFLGEPKSRCEVNTAKLSESQLKELVSTLNDLDVLHWNAYYNSDILDGIQWSFLLTYNGNLKKKSAGSNAYPESFEEIVSLLKRFI